MEKWLGNVSFFAVIILKLSSNPCISGEDQRPILGAFNDILEIKFYAYVCCHQGTMSFTRDGLCWLGNAASSGN